MATETTPPPKPKPSSADPPPPSAPTLSITSPTTPAAVAPRVNEPDPDVIHIPSYSRWFSWNAVHDCEARFLPEFFDGRSPSKNPTVYKHYRNAIIRRFRENPSRKITFTEMRKTIVGDVGSIRRVFDFLEAWGLINYAGSTSRPQLKWEDKETKSAAQGGDVGSGGGSADAAAAKKRLCSGCKTPCTIACFASEKHEMTLCARCYVRGNYRVGLNSSDFKRVEISEDAKSDWTDKETLQLLEATMHYGDDWKKVAEHVGGRSVKECVARFIKLPFGEQFDGPPESGELDTELGLQNETLPTKRMHLSPLADASNPIMAQAAFLSTLVGVDVAEVAARAALTALSDVGEGKQLESSNASNGDAPNKMEESLGEAKMQLEKEEEELEKAVSGIATQTKEIEDKILHFEEFDLQMERKWQQFQQLQNMLFVDQLTLLFHKNGPAKTGENIAEPVKID
ncbi:switch subunit 3 [Perilla frutescens var. hirtella]|uniref:Switch subunit 3 n=1 Tax=Perilla frutescens var. hirtella TaxID=608512 RepID=A0AAD4JJM7_PERFH|nr:switch subunit 3 [Perilla frutescens var. frutescens]KAH6786661.1 switch subunit 3 [Perilla frutescens var. hirtella]KAH6834696.1 switch subunit 3 [Perilla frutescens var. hirtella]